MECATLLRDIRFGMGFFREKGSKFFLLLIGFFVFVFFFSTGKKKFEWLTLSFMNELW